jgi:PIN domain nuclease of toxin-antitoxin system
MRFLLDTHAFIWWDGKPQKLSPRVLAICQDPENELLLSVASIWEIQIKSQFGKIRLRLPLSELIKAQQEANGVSILSIDAPHVYALDELPPLHKDPFDRILVAQAKVENLRLISNDESIKKYPVEVDW